jgi:hypothetical protein
MSRAVLRRGDELVTRRVDPAVQGAIEQATEAAYHELCAELAPYGLTPLDIVIPEFEQVIYEDEVPIYAGMLRDRRKGQ